MDKFGYLNTLANIASVKIIWAKLINNLGPNSNPAHEGQENYLAS